MSSNSKEYGRAAQAKHKQKHPEKFTAEARRADRASWYERNKARVWTKTLAKYGLSSEDYDRMLVEQNGVCAICHRPETWKIKGKIARLSVDHDHVTGKVRGLLCCNCNHMLGKAQDSALVLRSAAGYLERSSMKG